MHESRLVTDILSTVESVAEANNTDHVEVIRSPIFSGKDFADLPPNLLNVPKLQILLSRFDKVEIGDFGDEVVEPESLEGVTP